MRSELISAASNPDITAFEFLSFAAEALSGSDSWLRHLAAEAFLLKAGALDDKDFANLVDGLKKKRDAIQDCDYLINLATIGYLFCSKSTGERGQVYMSSVLWLIENHPFDPILSSPHCFDFTDEEESIVYTYWKKATAAHSSDVRVLSNAAEFMFRSNPAEADALWSMCESIQPSESIWPERLKELRKYRAP